MAKNDEIIAKANQKAMIGLLEEEGRAKGLAGLLGALNVSGGGNGDSFGGRVGFNNVPITNSLNASVGASGYYSPEYKQGQFNTYDAGLNYTTGKQKQHEFGVSAKGLNTEDPRYMMNYGYKW